MIAHVNHLQHRIRRQLLLEADVPTQRVRIAGVGVQERDGLPGESAQPKRRAHRPLDAPGERVAQGGGGGDEVIVRRNHLSRLAETLLSQDGVGGISAAHAERCNRNRRDEHAEATPDYSLRMKLCGGPREAEARAE